MTFECLIQEPQWPQKGLKARLLDPESNTLHIMQPHLSQWAVTKLRQILHAVLR